MYVTPSSPHFLECLSVSFLYGCGPYEELQFLQCRLCRNLFVVTARSTKPATSTQACVTAAVVVWETDRLAHCWHCIATADAEADWLPQHSLFTHRHLHTINLSLSRQQPARLQFQQLRGYQTQNQIRPLLKTTTPNWTIQQHHPASGNRFTFPRRSPTSMI